jgi:hypothetical protein
VGYYTPDLSGQDPDYKNSVTLTLFRTGQIIEFGTPVYESSIVMSLLADANSIINPGVGGWEVQQDLDVDETSMALMKGVDGSFNERLVKSIRITKEILINIPVRISYQQLYPVQVKYNTSGGQIQLSPAMMEELVGDVAHLKNILASNIGNAIIPNDVTVRTLDVDQHMTNSNNVIENEVQLVNTFDNLSILAPAYGAFFRSSFSLRDKATGVPFVQNTDYVIFGCDLDRTETTSETSGVYRYILILKEYTGEIEMSYHAYGGTINHLDVKELSDEVNNILQYLGNKSFLTEYTLTTSPLMRGVFNRLTGVEDAMRILLNNAQYGDVTGNGTSVRRTFTTVDTQLHWWNIFKLYTAEEGANPSVVVSDRVKFRIKLVHSKIMMDITASVDLTAERDPFVVACDVRQQDMGYDLMGESDAQYSVAPQLRVIYNDGDGSYLSGAYLQIGMPVIGLEEVVAIEDLSGRESCWKLLMGSDVVVTTPNDSNVALPSGDQTWDEFNSDSKWFTKMIPTPHVPYLVFEAGNPLMTYSFSQDLTTRLPSHFRVEDITKVRLYLTDANSVPLYVDIPVAAISNGVTGQAAVSDVGLYLKVKITDDGVLKVGTSDGNNMPPSVNFDLNYVLAEV